MIFKVGDKVKLLNEVGEGVVVEITETNQIFVLTDLGMDLPFEEHELLKINEDNTVTYKRKENQKADNELGISKKNINHLSPYIKEFNFHKGSNKVLEIDLHIEELVDAPNRLKNHEKLETQIRHFKECLEHAFALKISRLVFIHGVGEGILKNKIRTYLRESHTDIEILDGNIQKYGFGATEIIIRNLHK